MAEDVKSEVVSEKAPEPVAEKKEAPAPKPAPKPAPASASSDSGDWQEMGFASKRRYERFKRKFS